MENKDIINMEFNMTNDELEKSDIEKIRHNYVALKQLHIRANNENDRLNDVNEGLKSEILELKTKITGMVNTNILSQKMLAEAYTKINEDKEEYIKIIQELQSENSKLKE